MTGKQFGCRSAAAAALGTACASALLAGGAVAAQSIGDEARVRRCKGSA